MLPPKAGICQHLILFKMTDLLKHATYDIILISQTCFISSFHKLRQKLFWETMPLIGSKYLPVVKHFFQFWFLTHLSLKLVNWNDMNCINSFKKGYSFLCIFAIRDVWKMTMGKLGFEILSYFLSFFLFILKSLFLIFKIKVIKMFSSLKKKLSSLYLSSMAWKLKYELAFIKWSHTLKSITLQNLCFSKEEKIKIKSYMFISTVMME